MKEKCFFILAACAMILAIFAGCSASSDGSDDIGQSQWNPYDKYCQILLRETELTLNVGETYQLSVEIDSKTDDDVVVYYSSDNDRVASVSESGLVSAKSRGSANIFVSAENASNSCWCYITVNDPNMLTPENATEILGEDYKYKTTIVIPEGITGIGMDVFCFSYDIENIIIPNTVTYIAERAFEWCGNLKSIVIPSSVTSIGNYAFYGCENLQDVYIDNLESYNKIEFGNEWDYEYSYPTCYGANLHIIDESFEIPSNDIVVLTQNNVHKILTDDYYSRGYVEIPKTVKRIDAYTFRDYQGVQSVSFPNGLTSIGDYAFEYCMGLRSISFPAGLTSIGNGAFSMCDLKSISIPSNVTQISIGYYAFNYAPDINIESVESWLGISFANYDSNPFYFGSHLYLNGEELTNLVIPDGTTKINDYAFYNDRSLQSIQFSDGLTSIGEDAFFYCTNLQSITIPDGLTSISIADYTFYGCDNINAVNIKSVESWLGINFAGIYANPLYYAKHLYLNGEEVTDLVIPDGITKINEYAFYNYESLQNVTIPKSLTSIGNYAFYNCNNIKTVYVETHETWRNLDFGEGNYALKNANVVFMDEGGVGITVKFPKEEDDDVPNLEWTKNGNVVTISAESGHSFYAWFVDMQMQSTVESALEFDTTDKKAGLYSIMVVIDGKYSATATIEVLK